MPLDGVPDISVKGLTKRYGDVAAVDAIDLDIAQGEFFTMLGPSGSGKTTTLRMIAGFGTPDEGTIELAGEDVSRLPPYDRPVNTVFQDYALFPHMTVSKNVEYGLMVKKVKKGERRERAQTALDPIKEDWNKLLRETISEQGIVVDFSQPRYAEALKEQSRMRIPTIADRD